MMSKWMLAAICLCAVPGQDGDVQKILQRFAERRARARSAQEYREFVVDAQRELDDFAARAREGHPDLPAALYHAAEMSVHRGDPADAATRLGKLLERFPAAKDISLAARYALGDLALQRELDEEARERFADFVRHAPADDPRLPAARFFSALTFVNEARYEDALKALAAVRQEYKDSDQAWSAAVHEAITLHFMEKQADAAKRLEEVVRGAPQLELVERSKQLLADWLNVGKTAPALEAKDLKGGEVAMPAGRVALLYFFTASFEHADVEARLMKGLKERYGERGLSLIGVAIDKRRPDVERVVREFGIDWTIVPDGDGFDGPVAVRYRVKSLPYVLLIDRKGRIRFFNPIYTVTGREMRPLVEKLLAE